MYYGILVKGFTVILWHEQLLGLSYISKTSDTILRTSSEQLNRIILLQCKSIAALRQTGEAVDSAIGARQSTQKALFMRKNKWWTLRSLFKPFHSVVESETVLMKYQPTRTHYRLVFYPFRLLNEVILAQSVISRTHSQQLSSSWRWQPLHATALTQYYLAPE